jgi:hypothetical protein
MIEYYDEEWCHGQGFRRVLVMLGLCSSCIGRGTGQGQRHGRASIRNTASVTVAVKEAMGLISRLSLATD